MPDSFSLRGEEMKNVNCENFCLILLEGSTGINIFCKRGCDLVCAVATNWGDKIKGGRKMRNIDESP